ncbi:hypothetical protein A3K73_03700 [Candidatus Pacearchaeota archaeon RBG_13_36_9]|nr:MAG: hypothetical protein A3K73_03700 [Candidatus Pacearchaeota archaeon RBG_13_36_9]
MKYCFYCNESIEEHSPNELWCMTLTKKGNKIIEFEAFHLKCWKQFLKDNGVNIVERDNINP